MAGYSLDEAVETGAPPTIGGAGCRYDASDEAALDDLDVDSAATVELEPAPDSDEPPPDSEPAALAGLAASPLALAGAAGLADVRASFLAQPDPLYTTVAAVSALRISLPQTGHTLGPNSCTPWITSRT